MIRPIQETEEEDGIAQSLAHSRQTWWGRDIEHVLDTIVRENITECAAVLVGLGKHLMDIYKQTKDIREIKVLDPARGTLR